MTSSSVLRRVGIIISRRIRSFQNSSKCTISCCLCRRLGGDDRMMNTSTPPSRTSPWLMQPPAASEGGGGTVYKFYSLVERKGLSISQTESESESESESSLECVGSSHGWIALFNRRNNNLFLSNPLSGGHIKLPSMERVHDRDTARKWGPAKVLKLVLSSSPEDKKCCAMMIYGPLNRLAFCFPADPTSSSEWTPIGDRFGKDIDRQRKATSGNIVYEDLLYCKTHKWFSTMDALHKFDLDLYLGRRLYCFGHLTIWDPWDPPVDGLLGRTFQYYDQSSTFHYYDNSSTNTTMYWVKKNTAFLKDKCIQIPHIVHVDDSDYLYIAFQFLMLMNPDDPTTPVDRLPYCRFDNREGRYPSKTVGFVVLKLRADGEDDDDDKIVDDLDGLAMFVGINNSFALPASDFPELNPDSIYFTDSKRIISIDGRNDFGIFDYRKKTVVNEFDIDDNMDRRPSSPGTGLVKPSPVWFTPAPHS